MAELRFLGWKRGEGVQPTRDLRYSSTGLSMIKGPVPETLSTMAVIAGAALVKTIGQSAWRNSKARRTVIPLKLRRGTHVPWGKAERFEYHATNLFALWIAFVVAVLIYRSLQ